MTTALVETTVFTTYRANNSAHSIIGGGRYWSRMCLVLSLYCQNMMSTRSYTRERRGDWSDGQGTPRESSSVPESNLRWERSQRRRGSLFYSQALLEREGDSLYSGRVGSLHSTTLQSSLCLNWTLVSESCPLYDCIAITSLRMPLGTSLLPFLPPCGVTCADYFRHIHWHRCRWERGIE